MDSLFNQPVSKHKLFIRSSLTQQKTIHTCPVIYQEVLQGIRQDKEFRRVQANFSTYDFLLFSDSIIAAKRHCFIASVEGKASPFVKPTIV